MGTVKTFAAFIVTVAEHLSMLKPDPSRVRTVKETGAYVIGVLSLLTFTLRAVGLFTFALITPEIVIVSVALIAGVVEVGVNGFGKVVADVKLCKVSIYESPLVVHLGIWI